MVSVSFLKDLQKNFSKMLKSGGRRLEYESSNQRPEEVPIQACTESHGLVKHGDVTIANVSVSGTATDVSSRTRDPALWESVLCKRHKEDRWYRGRRRPFNF